MKIIKNIIKKKTNNGEKKIPKKYLIKTQKDVSKKKIKVEEQIKNSIKNVINGLIGNVVIVEKN